MNEIEWEWEREKDSKASKAVKDSCYDRVTSEYFLSVSTYIHKHLKEQSRRRLFLSRKCNNIWKGSAVFGRLSFRLRKVKKTESIQTCLKDCKYCWIRETERKSERVSLLSHIKERRVWKIRLGYSIQQDKKRN